MSKFEKKMTNYTQKYIKEIDRKPFSEEEKLVYKTIALFSVNSLIYFVEGLRETNTSYSGINPKMWYTELKKITVGDVYCIQNEITLEFLKDGSIHSTHDKDLYQKWLNSYEKEWGEITDQHLVDKVFPYLYLEHAIRNEYPFLTFSEIMSSLFNRLDASIKENIELLQRRDTKKDLDNL